jgi:hypothetical protein
MVAVDLLAVTCNSDALCGGVATIERGPNGWSVMRVTGQAQRRQRATNGDGRHEVARFLQPTRLACVTESKGQCFLIADIDRVRLTSGTKTLAAYLKVLGKYTKAWGMKTSDSAPSSKGEGLTKAAEATQALGSFMQDVHDESQASSNRPEKHSATADSQQPLGLRITRQTVATTDRRAKRPLPD